MNLQQLKHLMLFLVLLVGSVCVIDIIRNWPKHSMVKATKDIPSESQLTVPFNLVQPSHSTWSNKPRKKARDVNFANLSSFGAVCQSVPCIAKYESLFAKGPTRIPSIRHILWKTDQVSSYFAKQLKTWNEIHPNWTYVLWRDSDIQRFVAKHYTGVSRKFRTLSHHLMRIDMIRYAILHRFGGVYSDLDYVLVRPLDKFLNFPAVVTREAEVNSFLYFGMGTWPIPLLGNPAFMMSEPGHPFFHFCILHLTERTPGDFFSFAGPLGLSSMLADYSKEFPAAENPVGIVMVPPSRNFFGIEGNRLVNKAGKDHRDINLLRKACAGLKNSPSVSKNLTAYCMDVNIMDPITDPNDLAYAMHDTRKPGSAHLPSGKEIYYGNPVDIRSVLPNIVMADTIY